MRTEAQPGPYATNKILHHLPVIQQSRDGKQPPPIYLHFVLSDLCNHSCSFCAYRLDGYESNQLFPIVDQDGHKNNNPNRMIPAAKAIEILDDAKAMGTRAVLFTGGGEPTIHPNHVEIISHALGLGLDVALTTNGAKLGDPLIYRLLRCKWVRVSLDAGCAETYAAIRKVQPETFGRVLSRVQRLVAGKREIGSQVTIGVGFVVTRENWREVATAAKLAKELGADNLRISAFFQPERERYFVDFHAAAVAACKQAESLAEPDGSFRVFNCFGDRLADLAQHSPDYRTCWHQQVVTYIGGDLNVYRCCDTAYNERGLVGSLHDQTFRELWESDVKRRDFEGFDASGCSWCQFNAKNRAIEATVNPGVTHENFL